jgi:hypothetical protein
MLCCLEFPFLQLSAPRARAGEERAVTPREQEEYRVLRETIRERGTARVWIAVVGVLAWAALLVVLLAFALPPVGTLAPLVALAATFEAVLALHVGVERVGRYLFVFHDDHWERIAGDFGRPARALATDPLFCVVFIAAAIVNLTPMLATTPIVQEWVLVGGAHAAFVARVLRARGAAASQRQVDGARFGELKGRG